MDWNIHGIFVVKIVVVEAEAVLAGDLESWQAVYNIL